MGSICVNNKKEFWKILREGILRCNGEEGVEVQTGEWEDYYVNGILTVWMNKKVFDKIMTNIYNYKSTPYSNIPIKVFNKNNEEIDLLNDIPINQN